jgi:hypothetical protein
VNAGYPSALSFHRTHWQACIQSEWGRDFLSAVMTDNTPRWWMQLKAWIGAVDLASAERKHRRKLRELLDDANQAPGAAALLLQDEDFYAGQPFPVRSLAAKKRVLSPSSWWPLIEPRRALTNSRATIRVQ